LAQVYDGAGGWYDDGSDGGDSSYQQPAPASQSPYAYNQTYNQPAPQQQQQQSPYQWNQTYNPPAPPPAYQPVDPFQLPTVPDFYQQESQTYQPSIPKANPWSISSLTAPQQPQQPDYSQWDQSNYTFGQQAGQQQPNYYNYYSQEIAAQAPQSDPLGFSHPPLFMGTSADMKLTPPGPTFSENPETPFSLGDYQQPPTAKPYKPTLADFAYRPKLPYEQGYDPQVGSQVDPSKLFEYASPETMKNLDPFNMALNTLGAIPYVADKVLSGAKESDIPVVSPVAGGIKNFFQNVVSPVGSLFTTAVGEAAGGREPYANLTDPYGLNNPPSAAQRFLQAASGISPYNNLVDPYGLNSREDPAVTNWRNQQVQAYLQGLLSQGVPPAEAQQQAADYETKLKNPLTYAEFPGQQKFAELPAPVQLTTMFLDPIGNPVYNAALKPFTHGLPTAIKATSDATGLSNQIDKALDATVRPGSQKAFRFGQVADRVASTLEEEAGKLGLVATDVMGDFLSNKASPLYWEKIIPGASKDRVKLAVVDKVNQIYNASPLTDLTRPDTAITGGKIGVGQSELGVRMQDTSGQVDPFSTGKEPTEYKPAEPGTADPVQAAANAASDAAFNDITASRPPAVEPAKLPDSYKPIKLPNKDTGEISEFFNAAKTAQAIDVKALKLDGTLGKPTLRPALPLEEWGKLGAAIRGVNRYTTQPLSRVYLETLSRAARDPASNILKFGVVDPGGVANAVLSRFGVGNANAINARFKSIFGDVESLGPASITADVGGKAGKTSGIANLMYHVANPFNELSADVLRSATGGKFQSYSKFIEDNEKTIKELLYRREAIRVYDDAVKSGPKTEFFKANPEIYQAVQSGKMSLEQLDKVIQGRVFNGFDMNDLVNNRYNPAIPSEWLDKELEGVSGGTAGTYGKILKEGIGSLADRVDKENARRLDAQRKVSGYYRAKTPKMKAQADANARANANLIRLQDLDSNHPIVQQMLSDVLDAYDANRITLFPKDNAIYDAAHFMINAAINYAHDTGRYDLFSTTFKDAQATREAAYAMKYKAPPTDFDRMMALKDKYESGARMTPQQIAEYETWRDSQPIRNTASQAGVELPQNESLFNASKTIEDYQATIRQAENFKSREYDEFGGEPLTVAHQKQLAQVLFDKDYAAFAKLIEDVSHDRRYVEGITGEGKGKGLGVYVDKTKASADRTINRLQEYWKDANAVDTGSPGLPEATPTPKADFSTLYEQVNNPPAVRFNVGQKRGGKTMGNVLTPDTMKRMAAKFNRTETLTSKGDVYNPATSREQMNRWFQDFLATDQYYRQISNNSFKLDPDTLAPVRIADGISLDELMGKSAPERIGPQLPPLPTEAEGISIPDFMDAIKARYGEDAGKGWAEMDPANRDIIVQEISRAILGIDPLNPLTNPKGSAEHAKAVELLKKYLDDMDQRKADYADRVATGEDLTGQYNLDMKQVTQSLLAERFQAAYAAKEAAYNKDKGTFFDYRDKNRVDQVLGTVLPFQYWARQNFAYLARHFAANPYHFAAVLNFYQQLEKENSDPSIPDYAKGNILLWKNPDGSKVFWDFGSVLPFNPLGNNDSLMSVVSPGDSTEKTFRNTDPLAILFGTDIKSGTGKVIGREKGVVSSFLRPNPILELAFKSGNVNKGLQSLGLTKGDQTTLGADYPESTRAQKETAGLIPSASFYNELGSWTGATQALRNGGMLPSDLNPEAPLNELLFGKMAGKPQTKMYQELALMAQEKAQQAIAAYKSGNWTPEMLFALDMVQAENGPRRILSQIGLSTLVTGTPRQQNANKIYEGMNKAYAGDKSGYTVDAEGNKVYKPSDISQYFKNNPGAGVLTSTNDKPEDITQGLADNKTREAVNKLYDDQKAGRIDSRTFGLEKEKLKAANPAYFEKYPDKTSADQQKYFETLDDYKKIGGDSFDALQTKAYALKDKGDEAGFKKIVTTKEYQVAQDKRTQFLIDNPDFYSQHSKYSNISNAERNAEGVGGLARTNPALTPKPQKTLEDLKYSQSQSKFYSIGGDDYDRQQAKVQDYFDKGQDSKAYEILNSKDYKRVQDAADQFRKDNPDFDARYTQEYTAKYGKPPKTDAEKAYDEQKAAYYAIGGPEFDQTQKKIDDLFNQGKDADAYTLMNTRDYKRIQAAQDQFKFDNPDFARKYNADNFAKYGTTPKSDADKEYSEQKGQYANIGGAKYDAMQSLIDDYFTAKNTKAAYAILDSPAYQQAKAARSQFLSDNPDFAKKYKAETEAKYGPAKATTASSNTGSNSSASRVTYANPGSGRSSGTYTPKKTTASYAKSTGSAKNYNTQYRSTTSANTKNKTVTSPAGYVNPFKLPTTDPRNPFFVPGKAAPASRTSFNGTAYPAPARSGTPSAPGSTSSSSTWDANQKKEYAYQLGRGKAKAYAAAAANNYYKYHPK
jgi:hypothetical protein